jgi:UrcA family protein
MKHIAQKLSAGTGALMLTALMFAATDAGAADRTATEPDVAIKFSNVELNNAADAEKLYHKLRFAARDVCGMNAGGHRTLEARTQAQRCYDAVLSDAVRKIDQPMLTTLHASQKSKSGNVG